MPKTLRCTVCTWRGAADVAAAAPKKTPSHIPPPMWQVQDAYAKRNEERATVGFETTPPCPDCGHHLTPALRRPSVQAAM